MMRDVQDPTDLIPIDEADRLEMSGLEHARDTFDRGGLGPAAVGE